jgi:hypothetical protein
VLSATGALSASGAVVGFNSSLIEMGPFDPGGAWLMQRLYRPARVLARGYSSVRRIR